MRELAIAGHNHCQIARITGVPRSTVREWLYPTYQLRERLDSSCPVCGLEPHPFDAPPEREYAYLLGIYLGDGTVLRLRRTLVLCIYMDSRYPNIIREVVDAMRAVIPHRLASVYAHPKDNAVTIRSYTKAWGCLIPQTGPGRKHERKIELVDWQEAIVDREPEQFVRGLIHSDGCRVMNRVVAKGNDYAYPRYFFSQVSDDIRDLFCRSLEQIGVEYGPSGGRGMAISIHRRESVARLDAFVGPKR